MPTRKKIIPKNRSQRYILHSPLMVLKNRGDNENKIIIG